MNSRAALTIFLVPGILAVIAGCDKEPALPAKVPPGEQRSLPSANFKDLEVSEVILSLDKAEGPGQLTVKLKSGTPPKPWRPDWPALRGPLQPIGDTRDYTAEVNIDLKKFQSWGHKLQPEREFPFWLNRFQLPDFYLTPSFEAKMAQVPLEIQFGKKLRIRQVPLDYEIEWEKSLLVRDLEIVNDPKRTWDPHTGAGDPDGVWTFNHLIECIANGHVTKDALVLGWLESFKSNQTLEMDGDVAVMRNAGKVDEIIDDWKGSSAVLDIAKAPFRLVAIVNRFDMRTPSSYASSSDNDSAELRFVFCYVDPATGNGTDFLVIFEFGVPLNTFSAAHAYALKWAELSDPALQADRPANLAAITESVVQAGAGGSKPNGSNLNQIRTEELIFALGAGDNWEFREFVLDGPSHLIVPHFVNKTPASWVDSPDFPATNMGPKARLREWIESNKEDVIRGSYDIPTILTFGPAGSLQSKKLRAVVAQSEKANIAPAPWTVTCDPATRLAFIRNTCHGCHSTFEGKMGHDEGNDWEFDFITHIAPRNSGATSGVSPFLFVAGPATSDHPEKGDDLERRLEALRSAAESDPFLPFMEFLTERFWHPH